jgi:hypothetical protein
MNLNQAEISFREIISMNEDAELTKEQFVSLLSNLNIENVVTYNAEELQRKESLQKLIEEELKTE